MVFDHTLVLLMVPQEYFGSWHFVHYIQSHVLKTIEKLEEFIGIPHVLDV